MRRIQMVKAPKKTSEIQEETRTRIGTCYFCQEKFSKQSMTQHLKACKQRKASFSVSSGEEKTNLFHLVVEGTYAPDYWMHLEMPADLKLDDLDMFLRKTWVECCGHLSAFTINGVSYNSY